MVVPLTTATELQCSRTNASVHAHDARTRRHELKQWRILIYAGPWASKQRRHGNRSLARKCICLPSIIILHFYFIYIYIYILNPSGIHVWNHRRCGNIYGGDGGDVHFSTTTYVAPSIIMISVRTCATRQRSVCSVALVVVPWSRAQMLWFTSVRVLARLSFVYRGTFA